MINEMEKNKTMSKMSDLEFDKNSVEMMRYRNNKLAYSLGLGGLAFGVLASFIILNSMAAITVQVILCIFLNIFMLLAGFLACERTKTYSRNGSIFLGVLGAINVLQIFWLPLTIITTYNKWDSITDVNEKSTYGRENVGAVITEGGANSIHWLSTNGNFRGILAIVLLVISAAFYISAAVLGVMKSNKLNNYLDSLKVEKK
jgi:energy-coupling factor transporter transmembrane protein EcfT